MRRRLSMCRMCRGRLRRSILRGLLCIVGPLPLVLGDALFDRVSASLLLAGLGSDPAAFSFWSQRSQ